jgi:predicted GNAT family acetyltransferase
MLRTDIDQVRNLALKDPVSNCFIISRLNDLNNNSWSLQNEISVFENNKVIESVVYNGANIIPLETNEESQVAFAQYLLDSPRRASSIVGDKTQVLELWNLLKPFWNNPREIRSNQPVLVINDAPLLSPDPLVRPAVLRDLEILLPACVSMFTEEVGVSPVVGSSEQIYRARISEVIQQRKMFARIDQAQVTFKAEIGVATDQVCQIQGVWVPPQLRGRDYGKAGMAAVVDLTRKYFSPMVSLYVNDYNERARAVYKSVGFQEHSTFATVLF